MCWSLVNKTLFRLEFVTQLLQKQIICLRPLTCRVYLSTFSIFHNFLMKIIFLQVFLPFAANFVGKVVETVVVTVLFFVVVIVLLLVVDAVA